MDIEIFFNRPHHPFDTSAIIQDIIASNQRLAIAAAYLTNLDFVHAFIKAPSAQKVCLLNVSDIHNSSSYAHKQLDDFFNSRERLMPDIEGVFVLGSSNGKQIMHHKYIVADNIVWTGSYNFTKNAQNHYENILRIVDQDIADKFWEETEHICNEATDLINYFPPGLIIGQMFRCFACDSLCPIERYEEQIDGWAICNLCYQE